MRGTRITSPALALLEEDRSSQVPELTRIVTSDANLLAILDKLPLFAASDLPVLLCGEPGTGKELLADALWALSPRNQQRFFRLNCATLTESLACSELFGHVRGSFTDACQSRAGKFKLAHKGTLFLDEVADLPRAVQPRLLRAVEQGEIEPVGADMSLKVDVRLIAATNRDLPRRVEQGKFRQDLYDRLAVLVIYLPPLRQRREDVLELAEHFLAKNVQRFGRRLVGFTEAAQRRLKEHTWPGNVRELKNVITRAVVLSSGPYIREKDLTVNPYSRSAVMSPSGEERSRPDRGRLAELLEEERGNVSALARRLQVCSRTVYRWLKSYQIDLEHLREKAVGLAALVLGLENLLST